MFCSTSTGVGPGIGETRLRTPILGRVAERGSNVLGYHMGAPGMAPTGLGSIGWSVGGPAIWCIRILGRQLLGRRYWGNRRRAGVRLLTKDSEIPACARCHNPGFGSGAFGKQPPL